MKTLTFKNILIAMLILLSGVFLVQKNGYKTSYELRKNWNPPSFCGDENLKAINFLLNTEAPLSNARAVVALKDNGCFRNYLALVNRAQEVVDKENEVIRVINNADVVSVEMVKKFETEDPLRLFEPRDTEKDDAVLELTGLLTRFQKELDERAQKELDALWEPNDDGW